MTVVASSLIFALTVASASVHAQTMSGFAVGNVYELPDCTGDIIGVAYESLGKCVNYNGGSKSFQYGYDGNSESGKIIQYNYDASDCQGNSAQEDKYSWSNLCTGYNWGGVVTATTMDCWSKNGVVVYTTLDKNDCSYPQGGEPFRCEAYDNDVCKVLPESRYSQLIGCGYNSRYYTDVTFTGAPDSTCASAPIATSDIYYGCYTNSSTNAPIWYQGVTCGTPATSYGSCNCNNDDDYQKDTFDVSSANLALTLITGILVGAVLFMQMKGGRAPMAGTSSSSL